MVDDQFSALMAQIQGEKVQQLQPSRIDLPQESRTLVVPELVHLLVTLQDLRLKARQAHWNVRGQHFYSLHKLFDEVQQSLDELSDRVAERVAGLGGYATACSKCISSHTPLQVLPESHDPKVLIEAIANGLALLSSQARYVATLCECDRVTDNIVVDLAEGADKYLWQLEALLNA